MFMMRRYKLGRCVCRQLCVQEMNERAGECSYITELSLETTPEYLAAYMLLKKLLPFLKTDYIEQPRSSIFF